MIYLSTYIIYSTILFAVAYRNNRTALTTLWIAKTVLLAIGMAVLNGEIQGVFG